MDCKDNDFERKIEDAETRSFFIFNVIELFAYLFAYLFIHLFILLDFQIRLGVCFCFLACFCF